MIFLKSRSVFMFGLLVLGGCKESKKDSECSCATLYDLDETFGTKGQTTADFSAFRDTIYDIQIQSDGKIVAVGTSTDVNLLGQGFSIARFTADGVLDTSFATTGKINSATPTEGLSYAAKILESGNILVAGSAFPVSQSKDFAVANYKNDGTLDTSFGGTGTVTTGITGTASTDEAFAVGYVKTTSSTILGGYTDFLGTMKFALVKYQSDGTLENGFGTGGIVTTSFPSGSAKIYAMSVLSDGKIIAVGEASNGTNMDFAIAKYNADGSLDTTFDTDGQLLVDINDTDDTASALSIDSNGNITIAGLTHTTETLYDISLIRLSATGSLDTTFGTDGKVTTSELGSKIVAGIKTPLVKLQPSTDGTSLYVTGPATSTNGNLFGMLKFSVDGVLDLKLEQANPMKFEWNKGTDHASGSSALAVDGNGKVLLGGYYYINNGQDFALARFNF